MNINENDSSDNRRGEIFSVEGESDRHTKLAQSFWEWLAKLDPGLRAPAPDTIGSASGERMHVQWWCDPTGVWFATQVMDTATHGAWELFLVPGSSGQPVAGRRFCMGDGPARAVQDELWLDVFGDVLAAQVTTARYPAFSELVAAGSNPTGVTAIRDDSVLVAKLQSDVQYWQHLALSLGKSALTRESPYTPSRAPSSPPAPPEPGVKREWALKDIGEYAEANSERIVILPRAISATKRSTFQNPELLYECLEMLANEYTHVKTGKADRHAYKAKADALGIDIGGSVDPSVAGSMGELYFIRWGGRRRFLDQHLVKGNSRDTRYCMRIYFCYDEDSQKVIVGHMPSHLPTSGT